MRAKTIGGLLIALTMQLPAADEPGLPAPGPAWVVRNAVEPMVYEGSCPAVLRFTGEIAKESWGSVDYHWVRSDGTRSPIEQIDFNAQGSHVREVTMQWRVDPKPGEQIWAALEIISPPSARSNVGKAVAKVICMNRPATRPQSVSDSPIIDSCAEHQESEPTTASIWQCAEQRRRDAEDELARVVEKFLVRLTPQSPEQPDEAGLYSNELKRLKVFQRSQRLWSDYRGEACEEVYLEYSPGSFARIYRADCLARFARERTRYLRQRLAGDVHEESGRQE